MKLFIPLKPQNWPPYVFKNIFIQLSQLLFVHVVSEGNLQLWSCLLHKEISLTFRVTFEFTNLFMAPYAPLFTECRCLQTSALHTTYRSGNDSPSVCKGAFSIILSMLINLEFFFRWCRDILMNSELYCDTER